jgi:pyruvate dehydrogenase E2 component (dihydrolipoamide acetyltransferase)
MAYEFRLPDLGEGVTEGEIGTWLVSVGQTIAEDDPMVEVETDKATVDVPSPVDGVVTEIHASAGDIVPVGTLLITIATEDDEPAAAPSPSAPAGDGAEALVPAATPGAPGAATAPTTAAGTEIRATPIARRVAKDLGVDLATVAGSGRNGTIGEADVRAAAEAGANGALAPDAESAAPAAPVAEGRRTPLRGVRRRIAERLTESHRQVPKVTVVEECDFTELAARRGDISYVPFVVKAVVEGLKAFPDLNATLDGDEIVELERYDIGVAAQGAKGLVVPVLHGADAKSVRELHDEVMRLAQAVRDDTIAPEDLRGGTFTVTLAGKLGGYFATPLVNLGEAAILGVHRISKRPVVRDGEIVVRDMALVSCSFDHRITDGTRATMFLLHVIDELQRAELAAEAPAR